YTQARQFNSGWNSGISAEAAERLAQAHGLALPDADSYELQAAKMIAEIQTATITIGQAVWDRYGLDAIKDAYYNRDGEQSGWLPNRRAFANSADARGSMIEDLSKDGGFFDVGSELWPGRRTDAQNADRAARDAIRSMANNAFNSGDADEIGLAKDFSAIIRAVSTETRSQWNSSNKINQLADAGSMAEMLNLLRQLIEATEANGQVNVTYEEY
ncbi:MAG: hypothetical protein FWG66_00055, partial [Spirochaetes bacterium]|nr:hypothetical protein [Spirochaetota bacterium]